MFTKLICAVALAAVAVTGASAHDASDAKAKVTPVFDHVLPNAPGSIQNHEQ